MDLRRLRLPNIQEVDERLRSGDWQVHNFQLGACITEIREYDAGRVLTVHLLAGEQFEGWKGECVQKLAEFGRQHDCVAIEALCRPGLAEILKKMGWRTRMVEVRYGLGR